MLTHQGYAYALELLFQALHAILGPCWFEGTTFRSTALAIPLVRRAAEAYVDGSLLRPRLYRDEKGRVYGRLTKHAFWMLSTEAMHVWPIIIAERGLTVSKHRGCVYWDLDGRLPPRIDRLTDVRLRGAPFPADGWLLPEGQGIREAVPSLRPPPPRRLT
jgi:hypothetical protein